MIKTINILLLSGLLFSVNAFACDAISDEELVTIKNDLVINVLNDLLIDIGGTNISFSDDFSVSRHPRTGCENLNITGSLVIEQNECTATATYSTSTDAQSSEVTYICN